MFAFAGRPKKEPAVKSLGQGSDMVHSTSYNLAVSDDVSTKHERCRSHGSSKKVRNDAHQRKWSQFSPLSRNDFHKSHLFLLFDWKRLLEEEEEICKTAVACELFGFTPGWLSKITQFFMRCDLETLTS